MDGGEKIELEYKCSVCWSRKIMQYTDYMMARVNKVYCDECITRKMFCVTPASDELIATLN